MNRPASFICAAVVFVAVAVVSVKVFHLDHWIGGSVSGALLAYLSARRS